MHTANIAANQLSTSMIIQGLINNQVRQVARICALTFVATTVFIACSDAGQTTNHGLIHPSKEMSGLDDYDLFRRGPHILCRKKGVGDAGSSNRLMVLDTSAAQLRPMRIDWADTVWDYAESLGACAAVVGQAMNQIVVRWSHGDTLFALRPPKKWTWKGGGRYRRIAVSRACVVLLSSTHLYTYDRFRSRWSEKEFPDSVTKRSAWGAFTFAESISSDTVVIGTDAGEFGGDLLLAVTKGRSMSMRLLSESNPYLCERTAKNELIIAGGSYHFGKSVSWIGYYRDGTLSIVHQTIHDWRSRVLQPSSTDTSMRQLALLTDLDVSGAEVYAFDPHSGVYSHTVRDENPAQTVSLRRDISVVGRRPHDPTWLGYLLGKKCAVIVVPGHGLFLYNRLTPGSSLVVP
jgi:hypothetical protein